MVEVGDFIGDFGGSGAGMLSYVTLVVWVLLAVVVLAMCGWFIYWLAYKRKTWNLLVEVKILRSDGKLLMAEWARGNYNLKRGVVWVKRKRMKPVAMKPFDAEKYLQGNSKGQNILTVAQVSPGHYVPLLLNSFMEMEDDKTGEHASFAKVKSDFSESRSWKNQFEREAKNAYTIMNLLREYAPYIGTGLMIFMMWAGFVILYSKVA